MKRLFLICILLASVQTALFAQERIQGVMSIDPNDASKLIDAMVKPAAKPAGFLQAEGWFSTARPLRKGAFSVTLTGVGYLISKEDQSFDLNDLGLKSVSPLTDHGSANTLLGEYGGTSNKMLNPINNDTVRIPSGWGYPILPYAALQFNVGVLKNTELSIRFLPKTEVNYIKAGTWGIGLKHDVKQWIPAIALSNYSLSVHGSYSVVASDYQFDVRNVDTKNQIAAMKNTQWNIGLVASKKLTILTAFAGVKYINSATKVDIKGDYLMGINGKFKETNTEDFGDLFRYEYLDSAVGFDFGADVRLGPLNVSGAATISKYITFNLGAGFALFYHKD